MDKELEREGQAFREALRNFLNDHDLTPYALAKKAGVDNKSMYMMLAEPDDREREHMKPSLENILRLAKVMDMSGLSLFLKAYPQFQENLAIEPDELDLLFRYRRSPQEVQRAIHRIVAPYK